MNKIEKIKAEIKRQMGKFYRHDMGAGRELSIILSFIESLPEENPSEDLEQAAEESAHKWRKNPDGSECRELFFEPHIRGFKAGAQWQKEQMQKEAEPAEVGYFNQSGLSLLTEKSISRMPLKEGDKVKLVIIKED